jgi:hypothetical protein
MKYKEPLSNRGFFVSLNTTVDTQIGEIVYGEKKDAELLCVSNFDPAEQHPQPTPQAHWQPNQMPPQPNWSPLQQQWSSNQMPPPPNWSAPQHPQHPHQPHQPWPAPTASPFAVPPAASEPSKSRDAIKMAQGIFGTLLVIGLFGLRTYNRTQRSASKPALPSQYVAYTAPKIELTQITIERDPDGCGVIRPDIQPAPHGLGWSVKDAAGYEVLQRNALGETQYRYFQSGTFTIEVVAWDGEKYAAISNVLTITC